MALTDKIFKIEPLKTYFVFRSAEDYYDLEKFPLVVEEELNLSNFDEIRMITIQIIRELLEEGLIYPGSLTPESGFVPWNLPLEKSIARIEREWNESEDEFGFGPVIWFVASERGEKHISGYSPKTAGLSIERDV